MMLANQSHLDSLKIIDFGSAKISSNHTKQYKGLVTTAWYRAPEVAVGFTWSFEIDLVSLHYYFIIPFFALLTIVYIVVDWYYFSGNLYRKTAF
jgi:serine/threonine protein kinase